MRWRLAELGSSFVRSILPMHDVATFLIIAVLLAIIGLAVWVVCCEQIRLRRDRRKRPRPKPIARLTATCLGSYSPMSDRLKLAHEIAARTNPASSRSSPSRDARCASARPSSRFRVPVAVAECLSRKPRLTAMRGGLTAEEYRWKTIRRWRKGDKGEARPGDQPTGLPDLPAYALGQLGGRVSDTGQNF